MMADMEASLSVSLDLSSVVEEAVRSAVCSVLSEIQRLIGRNVAELRAAVARRDTENEKLRAQLESARRELREQARSKRRPNLNCDVMAPYETYDKVHTSTSHQNMHRNTDEDTGSLYLGHSSSVYNQQWDSDIPHSFTDPLENIKRDLIPDVDYNIDTTESDTDPVMIPDSESLRADPSLSPRKSGGDDHGDACTAKELRVVQVKEELPARRTPSPLLAPPQPTAKSKPYICGECGKSYLWLKNLKKHQKIHSGEAPFSCSICCKHFSSQQVFEEHQRVHTGERPHRCTYCPKTFNHLSNLKKHQLIHTGEKPHHCTLCGKQFRQIQHLKEHRKTHEDSKPFRCGECGWGFNHGSNFKRHLLVHTRQKMRHGLGS